MPKICPKCGGLDPGCSVCDAPPKHIYPVEKMYSTKSKLRTAFNKVIRQQEVVWEVQGIDISAWNGVMDFSITKTKCQYAVVRLGYGDGWKDSRCDEYRKNLIANDIPYAVYWYNKVGKDIVLHADTFYEVACEFPFQLGVEEDFEETTKDKIGTLNWIIALDQRLKGLFGASKKRSPYSNANFWNTCVATNNYFTDEQWVANWTISNVPFMPNGWSWKKGCKWQWSADGNRKAHEYGMVKDGDYDMDLNRYYGTVDEFNACYGTHILPIGQTLPPPPQALPDYFMPAGSPGYINIRSQPNPFSDIYIIGRATNGRKWKPIGIVIGTDGKEWWKINEFAFVAKWLTRW